MMILLGRNRLALVVVSLLVSQLLHPTRSENTSTSEVMFGLQLDDVADSYASSMVYNAKSHRLYITGGTYGHFFETGERDNEDPSPMSNCFFGVIQLPRQVFMSPKFLRRVQIGMDDVSEACSAVHVSKSNGDIYLLGHSVEDASILSPIMSSTTSTDSTPGKDSTAYGMVMHLDRSADLMGGMMMSSSVVQYPVAIDANEDSGLIFVASIQSQDEHFNSNSFEEMKELFTSTSSSSSSRNDMTTAGYYPRQFGNHYTIVLKALRPTPTSTSSSSNPSTGLSETFVTVWTQEFGNDPNRPNILKVTSLLYLSETILIMAGSTIGPGSRNRGVSQTNGDYWDGFVSMISPITGEQIVAQRIQSTPFKNDHVISVCKANNDNIAEIFVVGYSDGDMDTFGHNSGGSQHTSNYKSGTYHAYILKLNVVSREVLWVAQLGGTMADTEILPGYAKSPEVHGIACAVTPDGQDVYLAGIVKGGTVLHPEPQDVENVDARSYGGDDIFLAQYNANEGSLNYAMQIGTTEDDTLAPGNSLVTTDTGDAIILGNTKGSLMRSKGSSNTTDMFVLSFARKRGRHMPFFEDMEDIKTHQVYEGFSKSTNPYFLQNDLHEDRLPGSPPTISDSDVRTPVNTSFPSNITSSSNSTEEVSRNNLRTSSPSASDDIKNFGFATSDGTSIGNGQNDNEPTNLPFIITIILLINIILAIVLALGILSRRRRRLLQVPSAMMDVPMNRPKETLNIAEGRWKPETSLSGPYLQEHFSDEIPNYSMDEQEGHHVSGVIPASPMASFSTSEHDSDNEEPTTRNTPTPLMSSLSDMWTRRHKSNQENSNHKSNNIWSMVNLNDRDL